MEAYYVAIAGWYKTDINKNHIILYQYKIEAKDYDDLCRIVFSEFLDKKDMNGSFTFTKEFKTLTF